MSHIAVRALAGWLALVVSVPAWSAEPPGAKKLYRYTNDKGVVVLDFQIPPDHIYRGYTVLSPSGTVLEVVPPSMSPKQREELKLREPEVLRAQEEKKKRDEADRRLLAVFSTEEDAARARDRKLEALDLQISVDKGNVARLQSELDTTQAQAANKERAGQPVPDYIVEKIDSLSRQITTLGEGIKKRQQEKEIIRKAADFDVERLKYLLSHPEIVRELQKTERTADKSGAAPRR